MSVSHPGMAELPVEGILPAFDGATGWLRSPPLTPEDLRGKVVLVEFWTYTCINWLRTLGHVRAWARRYRDHGLVVIGVHTPEFPFEGETANVERAAAALDVDHPIALDSRYAVWRAFGNHYWPAIYVADAEGRLRHHQFGEGGDERTETVVRHLLEEAGHELPGADLTAVAPVGLEVPADWDHLESPETYLGAERTERFASPGGVAMDRVRDYILPEYLRRRHWALVGPWIVERRASVLDAAQGRLVVRFQARDVHLVMAPRGAAVPFRVLLDGEPPGDAHGLDVDADGRGVLDEPRLYQLVRVPGAVADRVAEVVFHAPGVEAYVLTFG